MIKNIDSTTKLNLTFNEWWKMVSVIVIACVWLTCLMLNTQYKIEELSTRVREGDRQTIERLNNMDLNFKMYVLRGKVEDMFVWYDTHRDTVAGITNTNRLVQEATVRKNIRDILNR